MYSFLFWPSFRYLFIVSDKRDIHIIVFLRYVSLKTYVEGYPFEAPQLGASDESHNTHECINTLWVLISSVLVRHF